MKFAELKNKNEKDLNKLLSEKREALRKFRFDMAGSRIKNVKEGMTLRRSIAKILTKLKVIETEQAK